MLIYFITTESDNNKYKEVRKYVRAFVSWVDGVAGFLVTLPFCTLSPNTSSEKIQSQLP